MNLFSYFKEKTNHINNFLEMDIYYVYKKLLSPKEVKSLLKNKDLKLLNFTELELYFDHRKNKLINTLNQLESPNIYLGRDYGTEINKYEIATFNNNKIQKETFPLDLKGIGIFKKSVKKQIKTYSNIKDLSDDLNNCILVIDVNNQKHIICYNYQLYLDLTNEEKPYKNPILFSGIISNVDRIGKTAPYQGSIVLNSVVREDVSGKDILYPVLAYFSNNQIIMSDRDSLTDKAEEVWKKFYKNSSLIIPYEPIDDEDDTITSKEEDDGKIYHDMTKQKIKNSYQKNLKEPDQEQKNLREFRRYDSLNWVYKLKDNSIESTINKLIKNHFIILSNNIKEKPLFKDKIEKLAIKLFQKRI